MIYKKLSFASILAILMLIAGCKGDTGPAGPGLSGNITGVVQLFNADGSQPIDRSGVTVSIPGTSFSTTTDSLGQWTLSNLTTGSYTITETKPGYGMTEQQDVQLVSGTVTDAGNDGGLPSISLPIVMAQPPNFSVGIDSSNLVNDTLYVWYSMTGKFDTAYANVAENYFLVLIGKDSNINGSDPNSYLASDATVLTSEGGTHGYDNFSPSYLEYDGFTSGTTAYVVVYPLCHYGLGAATPYSSYYDIASRRTAYTSLGAPSKAIRVTIP